MKSIWLVGLFGVVLWSCDDPRTLLSGNLLGPVDMVMVHGCPQKVPSCDLTTDAQHLLLVVNSLEDALKVFQVEARSFFSAPNPLFSLSVPVGHYPRSLAADPHHEFAFVANSLSADISVVDLAPSRLVETDSDDDPCTSFCGDVCGDLQEQEPLDDRCRAGVSRVSLDAAVDPWSEDIVTIPRWEGQDPWDRTQPLPVYVSLPGSGQLAVLRFEYPDPDQGRGQRMELSDLVDVGGRPSGLAITPDGSLVFAADEASESVIVLHTSDLSSERIEVGGPSRRLALAPDGAVLYVVRLDEGRISLVDVDNLVKRMPGQAREDAVDPDSSGIDLILPAFPRSVGFVRGVPVKVNIEKDGVTSQKDYTTELLTEQELEARQAEDPDFEEHVVKTFAYVSNLDGIIYLIDAENHRAIDSRPHFGPICGVSLSVGGISVIEEDLDACVGTSDCPYPQLAEFDKSYGVEDEERRIFKGVFTRPGVTRTEVFEVTWEGVLPGTNRLDSGRFEGWSLRDDQAGLDYIEYGVKAGDRLVVTSDPNSGEAACQEVSSEFEIESVDTQLLVLLQSGGVAPDVCWPEALSYQVRAGQSWVVVGTSSGLMERATMLPWQAELPVNHPVYDNGLIAFTLFAPGQDPDTGQPHVLQRDTKWTIDAHSGFTRVIFKPQTQFGIAGPLVVVDLEDLSETEEVNVDDRVFVIFEASNLMMEFKPEDVQSSGNYYIHL